MNEVDAKTNELVKAQVTEKQVKQEQGTVVSNKTVDAAK